MLILSLISNLHEKRTQQKKNAQTPRHELAEVKEKCEQVFHFIWINWRKAADLSLMVSAINSIPSHWDRCFSVCFYFRISYTHSWTGSKFFYLLSHIFFFFWCCLMYFTMDSCPMHSFSISNMQMRYTILLQSSFFAKNFLFFIRIHTITKKQCINSSRKNLIKILEMHYFMGNASKSSGLCLPCVYFLLLLLYIQSHENGMQTDVLVNKLNEYWCCDRYKYKQHSKSI